MLYQYLIISIVVLVLYSRTEGRGLSLARGVGNWKQGGRQAPWEATV